MMRNHDGREGVTGDESGGPGWGPPLWAGGMMCYIGVAYRLISGNQLSQVQLSPSNFPGPTTLKRAV